MQTKATDHQWIAVLDSRAGRLFELSRTPQQRLHLELRDQIKELWEEKQHGRPSLLAGTGRTAAPFAHEDEERLRRFAKETAAWLGRELQRHGLDQVTVFCGKALLGSLRNECPAALAPRLDLRGEDIAGLNLKELAEHPAVKAVLP